MLPVKATLHPMVEENFEYQCKYIVLCVISESIIAPDVREEKFENQSEIVIEVIFFYPKENTFKLLTPHSLSVGQSKATEVNGVIIGTSSLGETNSL